MYPKDRLKRLLSIKKQEVFRYFKEVRARKKFEKRDKEYLTEYKSRVIIFNNVILVGEINV